MAKTRDITQGNGVSSNQSMILSRKKEDPCFVNLCTFTKPVYVAYLRGMESRGKTAVVVFAMAVSVLIMAYGAAIGWRLDFVGLGLFGLVISGLVMGQPWMMANSKVKTAEERYGKCQENITRFYEGHMAMQNLTARVEAQADYADIHKVKETEDFIYLFVDKYCYFAIKTGFSKGEDQIAPFREFIEERAVNAKGHLG